MNAVTEVLQRKKDLPIASMIDIVFLLLVYFMATSSLVKKEADLPFQLPLTDGCLPDHTIEVLVEITEQGGVSIEGESFEDRDAVLQRLELLKAVADSAQSELMVNILPADKALHRSIVPVMDACAAAKVKNLSFNAAL